MTIEELNQIGNDVTKLLISGSYGQVSSIYGYALCYGREPEQAIKEDYELACKEAGNNLQSNNYSVNSKHFEDNDTGLLALIECDIPVNEVSGVLIELILNNKEVVYLEQISSYCTKTNA